MTSNFNQKETETACEILCTLFTKSYITYTKNNNNIMIITVDER